MVVYPVRSNLITGHENNVTIYCDGPQQVWKPRRVVSAEWLYGYAPVIRLKMAISGRHAHIHTGKTDISRSSDS